MQGEKNDVCHESWDGAKSTRLGFSGTGAGVGLMYRFPAATCQLGKCSSFGCPQEDVLDFDVSNPNFLVREMRLIAVKYELLGKAARGAMALMGL